MNPRKLFIPIIAAALTVTAAAFARNPPAKATVYGVVGPGYTITLKTSAGKLAKTLPHGTVTFRISDRSTQHDFHLTGGGVNRTTAVETKGSYTWHIKLRAGKTYTYRCDPHQIIMHGHFRVT